VLPESLAEENRRAFSWARSNPVGVLRELRRHPVVIGLAATWFLISLAHQVYPGTWVLYTEKRFGWDALQAGGSLAVVGLCAALVQGGLTRLIIPRLGERASVVLGLAITAFAFVAYGLASQSWMLYALIAVGSLGGITNPAVQGLISRSVGADEQGGVQGALTGLASIAGFLGLKLAAGLFGHFIRPDAPVYLPGAAFFCSAALVVIGLLLAIRSFRNESSKAKAPSSKDIQSSNLQDQTGEGQTPMP
jgi:DHA1 family tetracycline resistance protein-like MFS transporter